MTLMCLAPTTRKRGAGHMTIIPFVLGKRFSVCEVGIFL